jgi:hypothetical protein
MLDIQFIANSPGEKNKGPRAEPRAFDRSRRRQRFLCRMARRRFLRLCFAIFVRRFFLTEPMSVSFCGARRSLTFRALLC